MHKEHLYIVVATCEHGVTRVGRKRTTQSEAFFIVGELADDSHIIHFEVYEDGELIASTYECEHDTETEATHTIEQQYVL